MRGFCSQEGADTCEPSCLPADATFCMNAIYVMTDDTGSWPVLRSDSFPPRNLPGRRTWRFVAKVDDHQIVPMLTELLRKRELGEL